MRCIEIRYCHCLKTNIRQINTNMRCIEIGYRKGTKSATGGLTLT